MKRWILFSLVVVLLLAAAAVPLRPVFFLAGVAWRERSLKLPPLVQDMQVEDVSRQDMNSVDSLITLDRDPQAAVAQLRQVFLRARSNKLGVSIAGARHSQGGQTIAPDGIQIDTAALDSVTYDPASGLVHVGSGARWNRIIPVLDAQRRSVAVMQSDANFSVGGSLSVNCHGWQSGAPPIASTVVSMTVMTADGVLHHCSRLRDKELFDLVLGGYGLFGVILDADLLTVPDEVLQVQSIPLEVGDYPAQVAAYSKQGGGARLEYGRLCVAPSKFLQTAELNVYLPLTLTPWAMRPPDPSWLPRLVFRGEVDSDYGKELRWNMETERDQKPQEAATRNEIQDLDVDAYVNHDPLRTDILQEYFIPPEHFGSFVLSLAAAVRSHGAQLLNVTVRDVQADPDTVLAYARGPRLALVLFFDQVLNRQADMDMQACTRELIEAALAQGGTYYLPYRPHASEEEFLAAYPMAKAFAAAKRKWDPDAIFSNQFYDRYLRGVR